MCTSAISRSPLFVANSVLITFSPLRERCTHPFLPCVCCPSFAICPWTFFAMQTKKRGWAYDPATGSYCLPPDAKWNACTRYNTVQVGLHRTHCGFPLKNDHFLNKKGRNKTNAVHVWSSQGEVSCATYCSCAVRACVPAFSRCCYELTCGPACVLCL